MGFLQESDRPPQGCFNLIKILHFLDTLLSALQSTESSSTVPDGSTIMCREQRWWPQSPALSGDPARTALRRLPGEADEGRAFPASNPPSAEKSPSSLFCY